MSSKVVLLDSMFKCVSHRVICLVVSLLLYSKGPTYFTVLNTATSSNNT